ncbi:response regulator [Erythrobacter sp. KY5]|uniref:response regulator n=1 Tax=Erythrobacter sp. KY5 TaxID=2011159 RepID=UPI000DBF0E41|nr:response regulator [Erythrobacter sp. KY5]AWW74476.1 response regulator [Erythrobacter sp. KY5]
MAYILIADDDELIAELASQVLIDAGHACGWVTSGEECWALLQRKRPDILLLDQDMPGISGVSLLRKLRQSEDYYDLPVIMFTAMSGADDETQAIYAGANDYIRKPFDPRGLTSRIQHILSKRRDQPRHLDLKTYLARNSGLTDEDRQPARRSL